MLKCLTQRTFFLLLSIAFFVECTDAPLYETIASENLRLFPVLYEIIAMENLKSFPVQDENSSHNFTTYSEYLNWSLENQKNLKPYEQRRSVFTLFQNYEKKILLTQSRSSI